MDSPAEAATREHEIAVPVRQLDGVPAQMPTNEQVLVMGSSDEAAHARVVLKVLRWDLGDAHVRIHDLRRAATTAD